MVKIIKSYTAQLWPQYNTNHKKTSLNYNLTLLTHIVYTMLLVVGCGLDNKTIASPTKINEKKKINCIPTNTLKIIFIKTTIFE